MIISISFDVKVMVDVKVLIPRSSLLHTTIALLPGEQTIDVKFLLRHKGYM